jgi:DNA-binding MarR family transcriptional regulator
MTVAELLDTLQITKQSLARVLKQLIDAGHITQLSGPQDRRQRLLYPTKKGRALIVSLSTPQSRRIARALKQTGKPTGSEPRAIVKQFLSGMKD